MNKIFCIVFIFIPFLSVAQIITTIAGNGGGRDGGPASSAIIDDPNGLAIDRFGNLYFAENLGCKVRKIDTLGVITTIAGTGTPGFSGDGGMGSAAMLDQPVGVTVDSSGNVLIADTQNNRIRKVTVATGIITTFIGDSAGFAGDGGMATAAILNGPTCVCFDRNGNLYIGDDGNSRIRKVNTFGIINTIAGTGVLGSTGDGSSATNAEISVLSMCVDKYNNLYVAEEGSGLSTIRKIDSSGVITTVAGDTSSATYNGDGIPAINATLDPGFITFDDTGKLYVSDIYNNRVRVIDTFGIIHTIAGDGVSGNRGNGGDADTAEIGKPSGLGFDACGNLYIGQVNIPRIRKITFNPFCNILSLNLNSAAKYTEICMYPNPTYDNLTFTSATRIKQITLNDIFGRTIFHHIFDAETAEINVSAFPPGVYFVEVTDGTGNVFVRKMQKE